MTTTAVKKLEKDCGELSSNFLNPQAWNEDNVFPEEFLEEIHESYPSMTLEEFCANPPDNTEWVDGRVIRKGNMGILHGKLQLRFGALLLIHLQSSQLGGCALTEPNCQTIRQVRKPDIAYMSPEQLEKFGNDDIPVLDESFPLVVEILSPRDRMNDIFDKAQEYLDSGTMEVWLIIPKHQLILTGVQDQAKNTKWNLFQHSDRATSPKVLLGFSLVVQDFFIP